MILIFPMTLRDHLLVNMGNMALWVESPRQWESDVLWTFNECLYESGPHIEVHWTSKGRLIPTVS